MALRTERGQAPTGEREVIRQTLGSGLVSSRTERGRWYEVIGYRCECKSAEYRGRCAHVTALIDAEIRAGVRPEVRTATAETVIVVVVERPVRMCQRCDAPAAAGGPHCRKHREIL